MLKQLILAATCSTILFACSKQENPAQIEEHTGVTLDISIVNRTGDGFDTRARQLYSQEALQEVSVVAFFVYKKDGIDYKFHSQIAVPDWVVGTSKRKYTIPAGTLEDGEYTFVGCAEATNEQFSVTETPIVGVTPLQDQLFKNNSTNMGELFIGLQTVTIEAGTGHQVSMELTRKVAGVLGYFKNVPAQIGEEKVTNLKLTVSRQNTQISLTADTGTAISDVPYDLIDMDLTGQTVTPEGWYAGNDLSADGIIKLENSQLGGDFAFPVKGVTMTIGLYNTGGNALKTWKILNGAEEQFDLVANDLYSLGRKLRRDNTTGLAPGDPADPSRVDNAIDLQLTDNIQITVNPDWAAFYYFTVK